MLSREAAAKVRLLVAHYEKAFERFAECIRAYQALLIDVCPELRGGGSGATEQESKLQRQWQHALH
jgi:hypothetical protein